MKQNKKINHQVFTIMTDFGFDFSVASMKALILKEFPDAQIIDIDHSIKQFSILSGAFVIDKIYKYFPEQTMFICVVVRYPFLHTQFMRNSTFVIQTF
ncbi:SAM-dependent chlorinase/fluorinase [Patescibacteria group bacterium]|nr:SAM-dependent chlorinase/fluorinase [Patescibacteria group bacterium]